MPTYKLSDKAKDLIEVQVINGKKCAIFGVDKNGNKMGLEIVPPETPKCSRCGRETWYLDRHHIHGRKNSPETIELCSDCHKKLHMSEVVE